MNGQAIAVLAGLIVIVGLYVWLLRVLRQRTRSLAPATPVSGTFTDAELTRYSRHMILREIGGPGQRRLRDARVLVVGAGGLGAPALMYLAAAGVGRIGIIDDDVVEASNLQRQVIHRTASLGRSKVASAAEALHDLNPYIDIIQHEIRLDATNIADIFPKYDLVLDGTDNFPIRLTINAAAVAARIPVVGGMLSQWEGQLSVWGPAHDAPCLACIFPQAPAAGLAPSCAEAGVFGPLPGIIGTMMAAEAIRIITATGEPLYGRLLIWNALDAEARVIHLKRDPDCKVCGGG